MTVRRARRGLPASIAVTVARRSGRDVCGCVDEGQHVERRGAGTRGAAGPDALPGGRGRRRQGGVVPRDSAHGSPTCSGAKEENAVPA